MKAEQMKRNRLWALAALAVVLFVALACMPVAATDINPWPTNNKTYVPVTNIKYDDFLNGKYYLNLSQVTGGSGGSGSLQATHITSDTNVPLGNVYSGGSTGTFYVSDTGGRGGQDNIIIMVAINSTNSTDLSNFNVDLTTSGYSWDPQVGGSPYCVNSGNYIDPITLSYSNSDYLPYNNADVQQSWKFAPTKNYPIYWGQDISANKQFKMILADTQVGTINQTWYSGAPCNGGSLTDKGMAKITYDITSNPSNAAIISFNAYAFTRNASQAQDSINWANAVNTSTQTGWTNISGWKVLPT
jgi:hypothetical protein